MMGKPRLCKYSFPLVPKPMVDMECVGYSVTPSFIYRGLRLLKNNRRGIKIFW